MNNGLVGGTGAKVERLDYCATLGVDNCSRNYGGHGNAGIAVTVRGRIVRNALLKYLQE